MNIGEFQQLMKDLYFHRDIMRGKDKTMLWIVEEVGELAEAVREDEVDMVKEELADVIAWITSLANLYGLNLEKVLLSKYHEVCPRCSSKPCECESDGIPDC